MPKKPTRKERVEVVWPKTGHIANPLKSDLDNWLAKGWAETKKELNDD